MPAGALLGEASTGMFDAVVQQREVPARRIGAGIVLAVALHAGALAFVVRTSARHPPEAKQPTEVVFKAALPPPPPPPPLGGGAPEPRIDPPKRPVPVTRPDKLLEPKQKAEPEPPREPEKPRERPAGDAAGDANGHPEGVRGGDPIHGVPGGTLDGGVPGGAPGATGAATVVARPSFDTVPFGEGLSPPRLTAIAPPSVTYTREAMEAKVAGKALVKCTLTTSGTLVGCQIVKGLPFLDQAVLAALAGARYQPFSYQGRLVNVIISIPLNVRPPE
jgi:protein TonB